MKISWCGEGEYEVEIDIESFTGLLEIATIDDELDEAVGTVTATIIPNPDSQYQIAKSPGNIATMQIDDNDDLPVIAITAGEQVLESDSAVFTLTSTQLTATDRIINLTLDQGESNFIDQSQTTYPSATITMSAGADEELLSIALIDDDLAEPDGQILVTLESGEGYQIDEDSNQTAVIVEDNDPIPTLSIVGGSDQDESSNLVFTINASSKSANDLTVNLEILAELGDFLAGTNPESIELPAEALSVPLSIAINDDSRIEDDGRIRVSILAGIGYEIDQQPNNSATVNIFDNDAPTGISIQASELSINEGEEAIFEVISSLPLQNSIDISVSISQIGDIIDNSIESQIITLDSGRRAGELTIVTNNDLEWENEGIVTATLDQSDEYTIALEPYNSASISVIDDDQPTGISVLAPLVTEVAEGENVQFAIIAGSRVDYTRRINLSVSDSTGNFIADTYDLNQEITLLTQRDRAILNVFTEDDNLDEENGEIAVTILPGRGYNVATAPADSASVTILDNDEHPVISIQPLALGAIIEGSDAQFLLVADKPVTTNISINLEISDNDGNFLTTNSPIVMEIAMETGLSRAEVTIPTMLDLVDEPDGEISAEVLSGTEYNIAEAPNNVASVIVLDDDVEPLISIQNVVDSVYEDSDAEFLISTPTAPTNDIIVDVTLTKSGDYFENIPDDTVILRANSLETSIIVRTDNDREEETQSGLVTAIVNPGTGYSVASPPDNQAEVIVKDDDIPPVVSISLVSESPIIEGESATFRIDAEPIPQENLIIAVIVDEISGLEVGDSGVERTEVLNRGQSSLEFTIDTVANNIDETAKRILVLLKPVTPPSNYSVGIENTAEIGILDSDLPELSISGGDTIIEGNSAQFTIASDIARDADLSIEYTVSTGDSNFLSTDQPDRASITLSAGMAEDHVELFIETELDSVDEADGDVVVTLQDDPNAIPTYRVSESLNHATVRIQDQSIPLISISGSDAIVEGSDAEFTITANIIREQDLQIQYTVSDGSSNFLLESQVENNEVTLTAGDISETETILISTESDNIDEHNGQISVTLLPDDETQPTYLIDLLQQTAIVSVTDDDVPMISITGGNSIDEGDVATFLITADIERDTDLEIKYIIDDSVENSVDPTFASEGTIQFDSESSEVSILVPTINDLVDRLNGNVTINLALNDEGPEQYQINSNFEQAIIQVRDNDIPEISLVGIGLTTDFSQAEFEVSSDIASEKNQTIRYRIDYFQGEVLDQTRTIEDFVALLAGQSNRVAAFTIARPDNEESGEYTSILVTLLNDSQSIATYQISPRRGVSSVSIIEEDPQGTLPIISIAAVEDIVIEGSDAVFEVTVDRAITENLFVNYTVRENQTDFLAPEVARDGIVSFKPNENAQTTAIIIQTENDLVDETTGKIEIILENEQSLARSYFVSVLRGKASVVIEDDDQPVISVTGTELIVEGENAEFVFSADIARDHNLSIGYRINSGKSNFISNSQATTGIVTLNAGTVEETSTLFVATIDDFVDENSGEIVVTIQRDTEFPVTYSVSPASNRESLTVLDNDIPELTISGGEAVYEGDSAQFSITSNVARENNIQVNYEITDNTSDFLQSFVRTGQVELLAGPADLSTLLYISTINDSDNQQTGIIEVALRPDTISPALYTIVENNKTASVVVQDDDLPVISIIGNQLVTEGDSINLIVSADIGRLHELTIGYQIQGNTEQFVSPTQPEVGTIIFPAGEANITANLAIATVQDTRDESDGTVVINLQPDSALPQTYELSRTQSSVQVLVQDDDVPVISITAGESIVESENAEFTIQSNSILDSNISVNYSVSDGLSSFLSLTHASTGSIELGTNPGGPSTVLSIPTIGDFVDELDGTITVSLLPDANIPPLYEINSQNSQALVSVHDDDIPFVHIASLNDIVEGQVAVFYLWTDIAREQDLQVNYQLDSTDGDFVDPTQYREEQITLAAGASLLSSVFPVSTLDDQNEEDNGSISVSLQADNQEGQIYKIYPGDNLASVKIFDNDSTIILPKISVVTSTNSIQEGENAEYSITSDLPLSENLMVQYSVSDGSGNFLPQDIIYDEVELTASQSTATETVVVPTLADFVDEQNGQVILTLTLDSEDSPSYTINPEYGFGIANIEDDDKPALSITGGDPIIEGATAQFTISSTVSRESRLPINYEVSNENGNFLSEIQLSVGEIYLEAWETETVINVSTIQDEVDEANGEIQVRLLASSETPTDYTIDIDAQSSAVLVSDDDLPEVSISGLGPLLRVKMQNLS